MFVAFFLFPPDRCQIKLFNLFFGREYFRVLCLKYRSVYRSMGSVNISHNSKQFSMHKFLLQKTWYGIFSLFVLCLNPNRSERERNYYRKCIENRVILLLCVWIACVVFVYNRYKYSNGPVNRYRWSLTYSNSRLKRFICQETHAHIEGLFSLAIVIEFLFLFFRRNFFFSSSLNDFLLLFEHPVT